MDSAEIVELIRAQWDREFHSGFSFLRGIPSTDIWCFLDQLDRLERGERTDVLVSAAKIGAQSMIRSQTDATTLTDREEASWSRFSESLRTARTNDLRYSSLRSLKKLVGFKRTGARLYDRYQVSTELMEAVETVASCKATTLRKLNKPMLADRRWVVAAHSGGEWFYVPGIPTKRFELWLDYGGMDSQLRYSIRSLEGSTLTFWQISYEKALGVIRGEANWNYITEDNAALAVARLGRCIDYVTDIIEKA